MFHPSSSSTPTYSDLSMHHALGFSSSTPTAPTEIPRSVGSIHDKGGMFSLPSNVAASAPPPCYSYLPSFYIHRSTSSNSLLPLHLPLADLLNSNATSSCSSAPGGQLSLPPVSSSPSSSSGDFLEFSSGTLRRVFSTGDLQVMNAQPSSPTPPPSSGDGCGHEVGGPFSHKVGRYNAEERKERIERYRVKRHQRNFHKKITYACRKTLADSRPRVQGRFARNADTEADSEAVAGLETEAYGNGFEYCVTNGSSNGYDGGQSQWWETPATAGAANWQHHQQQQLGLHVVDLDDDEELWASLADMC